METNSGLYYLKTRFYNPITGRFISPDDTKYLQPDTINGLNLYAYCGNNPVMRVDPNGNFWDYVIDAAFIIWGIVDLARGGYKDWKEWVAFGVDVVFAVLPFVPSGVGQVIKVGNKIDDAIDVAKAINKIDITIDMGKTVLIGRNADRVYDVAKIIGKQYDVYNLSFNALAASSKSKFLGNLWSYSDNVFWLFEKLIKNYNVIDIGIKTGYKSYGLYYGTEKLLLLLWKTKSKLFKLYINS